MIDAITKAIRGMGALSDQDCLDIIRAMLGVFDPHADDGTPGALMDCHQAIEHAIETADKDPVPDDSWIRRQDEFMRESQYPS